MIIKTLASGSGGNAYIVSDGCTTLLLEAGIPAHRLCTMTDLSAVNACLISHEHMDHSRAAAELSGRYGLPVIGTKGTMAALRISSAYAEPVTPGEEIRIKTFTVKAFSVPHDAAEPVGYILRSAAGEKLLFITDAFYIPIKAPQGLTHLMVECNYSMELLRQGIDEGETAHSQRERIRRSHMSLETLTKWLNDNESRLHGLREIHIIHVSSRNGDATLFRQKVRELTGKAVY